MGIVYGKRPRLEDLESGNYAVTYALSESGQAGYAEKVDYDVVLNVIDDELDQIAEKLRLRDGY